MEVTRETQQVKNWFGEAWKPEPVFLVSQWADEHRILSRKASSEPGKWNTSRTPYLKEIMDVLSPSHPAKKIVFKKASQIGGTEAGNNWIGFIVDHCPAPTMIIQPTVDMAKRNSRLRIEPLFEESPRLRQRLSSNREKDIARTVQQKDFEGGTLVMTGANSAAGLRSMPARFLMLDEVDAYPRDVDGEGDPVSLVLARSRTFSRRKAFLVSTPTLDGVSKIDEEWEASDKRRFFIPCPHCKHFQHLIFKNLKWDKDKPESAAYQCENCDALIEEKHKTEMLLKGKWVAEMPGIETIGFHINSLYSPLGWYSWGEIAKDFLDAKRQLENERKTELMRTFINTVLGETYKEPGDSPEWQKIYFRRENYEIGIVPDGVAFLTAGVDVQKDRLECEVVGWGPGKESWSVGYMVFIGDTADEKVWADLRTYLEAGFSNETGKIFPVQTTAIDSGFNTQHVYGFVRQFTGNQFVAVKGSDTLSVPVGHPKIVDVKMKGKPTVRRGVRVWTIGVNILKSELYSWLKLNPAIGSEKTPNGFCHFPQYDEEFFKQLTAEKVVLRRNRKGFAITEWVKDRERNEALDCRVYARAAASLFGIDRFKDKDWFKFGVTKTVETSRALSDDVSSGEEKTESKPKSVRKKSARRERRGNSFW